jgi:hypothetical protein
LGPEGQARHAEMPPSIFSQPEGAAEAPANAAAVETAAASHRAGGGDASYGVVTTRDVEAPSTRTFARFDVDDRGIFCVKLWNCRVTLDDLLLLLSVILIPILMYLVSSLA